MPIDATENYFDHEADIGIIGRGTSLEQAFINGAEAVFGIMTDLSSIAPLQCVAINFDEEEIELAFVSWLNLLIAQAKIRGLIFSRFELKHKDPHWFGKAYGEAWREDTIRGTEVKGATLTMLSVKKLNHHWEARCVVDV